MKSFSKIIYLALCLVFFLRTDILATDWEFRGQLSTWAGLFENQSDPKTQIGLRYVPEGSVSKNLFDASFFESLLAFNMQASTLDGQYKHDFNLYRLHLRFATPQSETRVGLQKINFGPAMLLRSLRWFDRIDPTDPLSLTKGVYALRYKYNFINNTNFWLWAMYGNDKPKGSELYGTQKKTPEFGGRFQIPIPRGEIALTTHLRRAKAEKYSYTEKRLAIDGRIDFLLGMWFEAALQKSDSDKTSYNWQKQFTLGTDFTFGLGNGLNVLAEHLYASAAKEFISSAKDVNTSAIRLAYPLGIFDSIQAIGYYAYERDKFYQYYGWQRTFDTFVLNLSLFHYPSTTGINTTIPISGYGAQIMFIYNH